MRLTNLQIKKLRPPDSGQKTYFDDGLPGFGVRVSQGGTKSFIVMYGRKRKLRTLGRYPELSLADARVAAKRVQSDPLLRRPSVDGRFPIVSFQEAKEKFLDDCASRTKVSTQEEYRRLLNRCFQFKKPLSEITRTDVVDALDNLKNAPSERQHAFVAMRTLMNWCVRHGMIQTSPMPLLRFQSQSRARILSDVELRAVWRRAEEVGYPYGRIVQLLILTGQRRGEIAGLRRDWIKVDHIVFPQGFTKNKREHRLPMGTLTRRIIETIPDTGDLLFPARSTDDRPFSGWSKAKRQFDQGIGVSNYTLHDLRRTYSSNLARLGIPIHVTEKLFNHMSGTVSGVAAVYNRHTYFREMREAIVVYEELLSDRLLKDDIDDL